MQDGARGDSEAGSRRGTHFKTLVREAALSMCVEERAAGAGCVSQCLVIPLKEKYFIIILKFWSAAVYMYILL